MGTEVYSGAYPDLRALGFQPSAPQIIPEAHNPVEHKDESTSPAEPVSAEPQTRSIFSIVWSWLTWSYAEDDPRIKVHAQAKKIDELQKAMRENEQKTKLLEESSTLFRDQNESFKKRDAERDAAYQALNQQYAQQSAQLSSVYTQVGSLETEKKQLSFALGKALSAEKEAKEELESAKRLREDHIKGVVHAKEQSYHESLKQETEEHKKLASKVTDLEAKLRIKEQTEGELRTQIKGLLESLVSLEKTRCSLDELIMTERKERLRLSEIIKNVVAHQKS